MLIEGLIPRESIAEELEFEVEYRLKGKARPRFETRSGRAYMPTSYSNQVQDIQWLLRSLLFDHPEFNTAGAIYAIEICLLRMRRRPKSKKEALVIDQTMPYGSFAPGKPDWDNAAGTLSDAGNKLLYPDDDRIVFGLVYRLLANRDAAIIKVIKLKPLGGLNHGSQREAADLAGCTDGQLGEQGVGPVCPEAPECGGG